MTTSQRHESSTTQARGPISAAERFGVIERPDLAFTPAIARETEHLYERVKQFIPAFEWPVYAPYVHAINRLKKERGAVILAHNYQTPEIFHCVADIVGDSLQLARDATKVDAEIIIQCGVHFMAETSKLLNPEKTVLIPDGKAGCSLSESITGADVRLLRERYPGVPVVTYVNTSADVKAETDICCTSSNAVRVVESLESDTVSVHPGRVSGDERRQADQEEDPHLEGPLRGARALHGRRTARLQESRPAHRDHRPSGMPA